MSNIKIGDKNKIKNSHIGHQYLSTDGNGNTQKEEGSFATKHPVITSILVSFAVGFILLFSFWKPIINWIENLF